MNTLMKFKGTLATRAKSIADLDEAELRREAMRAANERDSAALWALTEAWITLKSKKKLDTSPKTLESYRIGIERLLKHWAGENLLRPSRNAGDTYVLELQEGKHGDRPLDAGTIQVRLAAARAFYKALRWAGATEASPFADVHAPKSGTEPEDRRVAYTEDEVEKLLFFADELGAVIVTLGADAGLRVAEMLDVRWTDIDFTRGTIRVRNGKGAKKRTAHLTKDAVEALGQWRAFAPTKGDRVAYVFPFTTTAAARLRLQELCRLSGVTYKGVHALRHFAGTMLYQQTGDLNVPRKQLGHSDISTTTIYAKMDDVKLKNALARRRSLLRKVPKAGIEATA
jgi:integrase/recombinase XerC